MSQDFLDIQRQKYHVIVDLVERFKVIKKLSTEKIRG